MREDRVERFTELAEGIFKEFLHPRRHGKFAPGDAVRVGSLRGRVVEVVSGHGKVKYAKVEYDHGSTVHVPVDNLESDAEPKKWNVTMKDSSGNVVASKGDMSGAEALGTVLKTTHSLRKAEKEKRRRA